MDTTLALRIAMWAVPILVAAGGAWATMRVVLRWQAEKIDNVKAEVVASESRVVKKIDESNEHFEEDITRLGKNQRTTFEKLDKLSDNLANAVGDIRVALTAMAGKYGNDETLLVMIRDIGKKRNGR